MSKTLIIDAGHGGIDGGARGFGVNEKVWTLRMSLYQYNRLKELGGKVFLTRSRDVTLNANPRTKIIRDGKYDLCISNHWNAFNGTAQGVETIHSIYANPKFARDIANALVKVSGLNLRRVFSRKYNNGDYYFMHRQTGSTQTVIIEYAFIDNRRDHNWYQNDANFTKAGEAVIEVLCKYMGIKYRAPGVKPTPDKDDLISVDKKVPLSVSLNQLNFDENEWGTKFIDVEGKFKVGSEPIRARFGSPNVDAEDAGQLQPGTEIKFDFISIAGGYVWLRYRGDRISQLPIGLIKNGKIDMANLWGEFI